jgi:hypothetical protein
VQITHQKGKRFVGLIYRPTSMIMYTVANTISMIVDRIRSYNTYSQISTCYINYRGIRDKLEEAANGLPNALFFFTVLKPSASACQKTEAK